MVEKPAYLFLGEDYLSKASKVDIIKKGLFPPQSDVFDLEILHGRDLTARQLSESLKRLPAISPRRLVIIKDIDRLNASARGLLISYLKKPLLNIHLILETDKSDTRDAFLSQLLRLCRVFNFRKGTPAKDVFGLAEMVARRRPPEALKILYQLLLSGEKPYKILGVLIWQWKKLQGSLSKPEFQLGLQLLLETDLNIKRGKIRPDFALELLVAKLSLSSRSL